MDHRFRRARATFNGNHKMRPPPQRAPGTEVRRCSEEQSQYLARGGEEEGDEDLVKVHGIKRLSIFFPLPYREVSELIMYMYDRLPCIFRFNFLSLETSVSVLVVRISFA